MREYVGQLEGHLGEVHRHAARLIKRQAELGASLSEFGAAMVGLGKFEQPPLADHFVSLGEKAGALASASQVPAFSIPSPCVSYSLCAAERVSVTFVHAEGDSVELMSHRTWIEWVCMPISNCSEFLQSLYIVCGARLCKSRRHKWLCTSRRTPG